MKPLNIIFAGTPEFSVPALEALVESPHQVSVVLTQPDRPAGRGRKLKASPVKQTALTHDLEVWQPQSLKAEEVQQQLRTYQADVMVVVAYGLILPQAVLDIPRDGCLNIHASLLPRWRGAAPIHRAVLAGDDETGVTIMQMDAGLDTGDMLLIESCPITSTSTTAELHDTLAAMGGRLLLQALEQVAEGALKPVKQDEKQACYAHKLSKAEANIDWQQSAVAIDRQVRAFNPWPVAQSNLQNKSIKVWQTRVLPDAGPRELTPGQIIATNAEGLVVQTGDGQLLIESLQPAGSKRMSATAFLNAHDVHKQCFH